MSNDTGAMSDTLTLATLPPPDAPQPSETITDHPNRHDALALIDVAIAPFGAHAEYIGPDGAGAQLLIVASDPTSVRTAALHALIASDPQKKWSVFGMAPRGDAWTLHILITPFPQ